MSSSSPSSKSDTTTTTTTNTTNNVEDSDKQSTTANTITIHPKREHYSTDKKPLCSYGGCVCTQRPMRGYSFCVKHILQDSSAPFKQCDFISRQTGKRCGNPVSIPQDDTRYCNAHKQMLGLMPRGSLGYSRRKRKGSPSASSDKPRKSSSKRKASDKSTTLPGEETETDEETSTATGDASTSSARKRRRKLNGSASGSSLQLPSSLMDANEHQEKSSDISEDRLESLYYDNSETDSDVPTDIDEDEDNEDEDNMDVEAGNKKLHKTLADEENLSEEDFLKLRRERILKLLQIYQCRYSHLKLEIKQKYDEFIKQRNAAIHRVLSEHRQQETNNGKQTAIDLRIRVSTEDITEADKEYKRLLAAFVKYPQQQPHIEPLRCTKVEKYAPSGEPLCSFEQCESFRMYLSEFCFEHILYDPNQVLYVPAASDDLRPILKYSNASSMIQGPSETSNHHVSSMSLSSSSKKQKKTVVLEDKRKRKSTMSSSAQQQRKQAYELIDKVVQQCKVEENSRDEIAEDSDHAHDDLLMDEEQLLDDDYIP